MNELLNEYANQFSEDFPIQYVLNLDEDKIKNLIINAIETNTPYGANR